MIALKLAGTVPVTGRRLDMAIVYSRGGVWYARYQHQGKQYLRSTGIKIPAKGKAAIEKSKTDAEAKLHRMLVELRGGESVDALFSRLTEAIDSLPKCEQEPRRIALADRLRSGISAQLSVEDAWDAWLNSPRRGKPSESTISAYLSIWGLECVRKRGRKSLHGFKTWLKERNPKITYIHEVTDKIAEEYAGFLMHRKIAPRTYNASITFLRSMFKTLKNQAGLTRNVWDDIPQAANDTQGRRNLSNEELKKVCESARGDLRYLIALGLYTGIRLGDAVTLKWDAGTTVDRFSRMHNLGIDISTQVIRLIPQKTRRKKRILEIPIHPVLGAMLTELREKRGPSDEYLFPEWAALYLKGQSYAITAHIQAHFRSCGIETTEHMADGSRERAIVRVGFHSLRHSFVSLCAANKVPQHAIQELVGHGSPAMTAIYSHADDAQKAAAILSLPTQTFNGEED
jgi:integrase